MNGTFKLFNNVFTSPENLISGKVIIVIFLKKCLKVVSINYHDLCADWGVFIYRS